MQLVPQSSVSFISSANYEKVISLLTQWHVWFCLQYEAVNWQKMQCQKRCQTKKNIKILYNNLTSNFH